ncbi:MAG TPA: methyltransferase domain-containing protein [Gemmata sp.]|jgi:tRNA (guanine-N7-)-methyltransferase|nr:methyltransferase domain-containing protein [Gemmata sp.]
MTQPHQQPDRFEREFGVAFPGQIQDSSQWTQTALKAMPAGLLDWKVLFGREAPVVLDIGCGNGRYLIGSALNRPDHNHLGTDILPVVIRYARKRGNQRGLTNLKFAVLGGRELLEKHVGRQSVAEIHCYHPQPYYDPSKIHLRLITPTFLTLVHRSLKAGGLFVIQTDNPGYWKYIREVVPVFFDFVERVECWPDATRGRTRREIVALKRKLKVFRGLGFAKKDLSEAEALRQAELLPPPSFDADRHLLDLDRLA